MEAIVHIGLPKTGSTAIQTYLAAHARGLSERGIHYETGSWLGDTNHFKLPLAVLRSAGHFVNTVVSNRPCADDFVFGGFTHWVYLMKLTQR